MLQPGLSVIFFFVLFSSLLLGVGCVFAPFNGSLLAAFCLAISFYPIYSSVRRRWPRRSPTFLSLLMVIGVLLVIVIPLSLLGWILVAESDGLNQVIKTWSATLGQWSQGNFGSHTVWISHIQEQMHRLLGLGPEEIQEKIATRMGSFLGTITHYGAEAAQHAVTFLFHTFIMLFALFFFFRDGPAFCDQVARLLPLPIQDTHTLFGKIQDIVAGVIRGWLLTSLVQGTLATCGYMLIGLQGAVLLGVLTALIGLLPVVGTFGVWIPIVIFLFMKGATAKAIFVLAWCALIVVGLVDTWVRPYFVGQRLELPLFFLFFGLLGGAEAFGIKGIILGPLLIALAPAFINIYRRHFRPMSALSTRTGKS